jgi:Arc/MetJ-type ribon-helix-helix transcriptional regulator
VSTKTQSALRATLKQEDAALKERLPEATVPAAPPPETAVPAAAAAPAAAAEASAQAPVVPASPAPASAQPATPPKAEKRKRESFSLAASDRRRLDTLRAALKAEGRRPSKSELVRAGLAALAAHDSAAVTALVSALSPTPRAADKKARRTKNKTAAAKGKRKRKSGGKKR